jgi:Mce-associated membrane protein
MLMIVLLATVTLAAVAATTVLGLAQRRVEAIANARFDAVAQARQRVAEVLSYGVDTIDADVERGRQATAGTFAQYYVSFAQRAIAPAVRQAGTSSLAVVGRAAAVSVSPDTVVVVAFIDQRTSSKVQPEPRSTSSTVRVTMTNVAGQWLISELTPTSS